VAVFRIDETLPVRTPGPASEAGHVAQGVDELSAACPGPPIMNIPKLPVLPEFKLDPPITECVGRMNKAADNFGPLPLCGYRENAQYTAPRIWVFWSFLKQHKTFATIGILSNRLWRG
jgi:hypothetical protein